MPKVRNYNTPNIVAPAGTGVEAQYPGQRLGMSMEQAKKFVQNQVKSIGLKTALVIGPNSDKIVLPGDASIFIGLGFNKAIDCEFTLNVNQSIIHESIGTEFATVGNTGGLGIQPYFPVNIPVTGNDTIKLDFQSTVATTLKTLVYYK